MCFRLDDFWWTLLNLKYSITYDFVTSLKQKSSIGMHLTYHSSQWHTGALMITCNTLCSEHDHVWSLLPCI